VIFNHRDVELARQQNDGATRQQRHRQQHAELRFARQHGGGFGPLHRLGKQVGRTAEQPERHEHADRYEADELDQRFGRNRQHQAILVFGGVDVARTEQYREQRHRQRHQ
jgi:hypothetical protein